MSDAAPPLRTLAFGDLDGAAWGVAWFPIPPSPASSPSAAPTTP